MNRIKSISGLKIIMMILIVLWHSYLISSPDLGARCCEFLFACSGFCIGYIYIEKYKKSMYGEGFKYVYKKIKNIYFLYFITILISYIYLIIFKGLVISTSSIIILILQLLFLKTWFKQETYNGATRFLVDLFFAIY